ncbi:MFS transporter [Novosphingobium sp. G106]|uniref:MFS transporter n=1 Tax=Novosphingobium sp. G106 TaxID=2849500 RepID=UPI001C2CF1C1|nr:MFS transporter [Novosphingobium sp. G106]MBV1686463.1 MFS transporter [Novosphingobium sp. G106]
MHTTSKHMLSRQEWAQHWPLVAVSAIGISIISIHLYSLGVLIEPLQREFRWTRTEIMLGPAIASANGIFLAIVSGWLMDRLGPRRIALPGLAAFCLSMISFAAMDGELWKWYAVWILLSLSTIGLLPNVWCGAVATRFERSRAFAFAVTICGLGLGSAVIPGLTTELLAHFGWRGAYVGLGLIWAGLTLTLSFLFLRTPRDVDGIRRAPKQQGAAALPGVAFREGVLSSAFFKLLAFGSFFSFSAVGVIMNLVPLLRDKGLSAEMAAAVAGSAGLMSIVGRLGTGLLLDRCKGAVVGGIVALMPVIPTLVLLLLPVNPPTAFLAAGLLGICLGAEVDMIAYLASRHFGLRSYGVLFGFLVSGTAAGTSLGPLAAAALRDSTGSYNAMLWLTLPCYAICSICLAVTGAYPVFRPSTYE